MAGVICDERVFVSVSASALSALRNGFRGMDTRPPDVARRVIHLTILVISVEGFPATMASRVPSQMAWEGLGGVGGVG